MTTVVLDASIVLKWVLADNEELVEKAKDLHDQIVSRKLRAIAPESILVEIANVMFWKKKFNKEEIVLFLDSLTSGLIEIIPFHNFELTGLMEVMSQYHLSIYDAYYVLLAKENDCKLVTLDRMILKIRELATDLRDHS